MHGDDRSPEAILATEWSEGFERAVKAVIDKNADEPLPEEAVARFFRLSQNAVVMSHFKYGHVMDSMGKIDFVQTIGVRVNRYLEGGSRGDVEFKAGNVEWLTDVYNFAMIEAMHREVKDATFARLAAHPVMIALDVVDRPSAVMDYASTVDSVYRGEQGAGLLTAIGAMALVEFVRPEHPQAHYKGLDNASPGVAVKDGDEPVFLESHSRWW